MPDHGASSFESEEGKRRVFSFQTVPWLPASGYDPRPIMRAPSISRGAATTSDVVRGRCESVAGSKFPVVARRSRTVVKGRRGKRSRDGTPREAVDHGAAASRIQMRRAQRAPRSTSGWGERVPSIEPFSPPPLDPPSPVARSRTKHFSPRPLHPRPRRPLQFQAAAVPVASRGSQWIRKRSSGSGQTPTTTMPALAHALASESGSDRKSGARISASGSM